MNFSAISSVAIEKSRGMVNSCQEPAAGLEEDTEEGSHGDPCWGRGGILRPQKRVEADVLLLRAESKDANRKEEGMETVKRACIQGLALEVI